jgi:hypothetical protein
MIFTEIKDHSHDVLILSSRGDFLHQYGHRLGLDLAREASAKLDLLSQLCDAASTTVEVLQRSGCNESKNNQMLLLLDKTLAYLGIDDNEFIGKLKDKPFEPALFVKKLVERHPKLFDLFVYMHRSSKLGSNIVIYNHMINF